MPLAPLSPSLLHAVELHQAGRLDEAEAVYRELLGLDPEDADALHYLGLVAHQKGDDPAAIEKIQKAIALRTPSVPPEYFLNLGNALKGLKRGAEALAAYENALVHRPDWDAAHHNIALLKREWRRTPEGILALQATCASPDATAQDWVEFGESKATSGEDVAALGCFDRALELLRLRPCVNRYDLTVRIGRAALELSRPDAAIRVLGPLLNERTDDADLLNALGCAQSRVGRLSDALESLRKAIAIQPESPQAADNLASALKDAGCHDEALATYRDLLARYPGDPGIWSNYLYSMLYSDKTDRSGILAEHRRSVDAFSKGVPELAADFRQRSSSGPIRIGYLSADLHNHPVAYFLLGILRHHEPAAVQVHMYDNGLVRDEWTERLRSLVPFWHQVRMMSDRELVERIRSDEIDVLVELSGHTGSNRLAALALRAAPVQATYLGYPGSTGLPWIDWRIVDATTDPDPEANAYASEQLFRLNRGIHAYEPPADAPSPCVLPAIRNRHLTFGVSTNLAKVTPTCLDYWANVLKACETSRLVWKSRAFADPWARRTMERALQVRGIHPKRLKLVGWSEQQDRWQFYQQLDASLDTYPYNQATNTCEALWMGVPTISICGASHRSRVGRSILQDAGLGAWAIDLDAHQLPLDFGVRIRELMEVGSLAELRREMRRRLLTSRLCNTRDAARQLEAAYRSMLERVGPGMAGGQ